MTDPADDPRRLRVVVIDDTEDLRQLLGLALTRGGFEIVGEAADGRAGIDVVRGAQPDVVLLDLAMPVMDGMDALPVIRRDVPTAKIIVLSGFGAHHMSARAVAGGADGYVQKGSSLRTILDYVRSVCSHLAPRSPRPLTVVPAAEDAPGDASEAPGARAVDAPWVSGAPRPGPRSATGGSTWEALERAPFGVVEVADEPLFRVHFTNGVAQRLLGAARPGTPLAITAPELASLVSYHRRHDAASFEIDLEGGPVRVSLRRTGRSVLVYLVAIVDDTGPPRRSLSATAHALRGPAAALHALVEDAEPGDPLAAALADHARTLERLTADLVTVTQVQHGALRVALVDTDPSEVVRRAVGRTDVDVVVEDDRAVRADPDALAQVVTDLLANARIHGAPPVEVRVHPAGDHVAIAVGDAGPGLAEDVRDRLRTDHDGGDGPGLGLVVVRALAAAMGGGATYAPGPHGGAVLTLHLLAVRDGSALS